MTQHVRDIMTRDPITVSAQSTPAEVARRMRDADTGAVLVTDDDHLRGLVTDRDLIVRIIAEGDDITHSSIQKACSEQLVTVSPDDDVDHTVQLMREKAIRRLPVVEGDTPVGIVSIGDLAIERDPDSALGGISAARPNT